MANESIYQMGKAKVEAEPCACVSCSSCGGSDNYWVDLRGQYSPYPLDMGDLETCDECSGLGIVETCDRCQLLTEMDYEAGGQQ